MIVRCDEIYIRILAHECHHLLKRLRHVKIIILCEVNERRFGLLGEQIHLHFESPKVSDPIQGHDLEIATDQNLSKESLIFGRAPIEQGPNLHL
jgi:hypothetical protein